MPHLSCSDFKHKGSIPQSVDVLIVGAGMSGLYAAWRILQKEPTTKVTIVDRLNRTGGRLDSDLIEFQGGQTVKEEEGGMRFTFDSMDDLMSLFLILGIDDQIVPFPMNSGGNNRLYFRGNAFTNADSQNGNFEIWEELYNLEPSESGINPSSIIDTVFNRILSVNPQFKERPDNRSPEFWQKFRLDCQWNGVALNDWTLWDLLMDMGYSNECVTLLYRLLGFNGTFLSQMNAGVAYQLLEDFPEDPQFRTLQEGFSTLPNALVEAIGRERIFLNTTIQSIEKAEGSKGSYTAKYVTVDGDGEASKGEVTAKKVILGLPRLALEKLFIKSNALNRLEDEKSRKLWDTLQTTTNQALLKVNLYYDKAWWGNNLSGQPAVAFGPNFSDLPLGSVYPFYSIDQETFAALEYQEWLTKTGQDVPPELAEKLELINQRKYQLPAALTIYCDYLNINFWKGLQRNGELFTSPMQEELANRCPQTVFAASQAVVRTATEFFKKLFNTHYVPQPVLTSARIWDGSTRFDDPASEQFGFGVHQWALHADDRQVMADLVEPLPNLYTCGEAFSDYQGWVEGALRSTDLVLAKGFGLDPISEVYQRENLKSPSEAIKESYDKRSTEMIKKYIDPNFDPQGSEKAGNEEDPQTQLGFGVKLTYFDKK